jgi:hypothetical protein
MLQSRISYFWKEAGAAKEFRTGISLHSHTSHSLESLSFISVLLDRVAFARWYLERHTRQALRGHRVPVELFKTCWTPPLTPREAYDLESRQIEQQLGLQAMVSLTDHDSIEAASRLRVLPGYGNVPISVEWTIPFQEGHFHLGIHNLPERDAGAIMSELAAYTADPVPKRLTELMQQLNEIKSVLIVINHPIWNLAFLEPLRFRYLLTDFLSKYSGLIHAFELNGLRSWKENQAAAELALGWNQVVISGGDRHGCEPNANVNLTNAQSFEEFVHEVRFRRMSDIMFMPQFADPIAMRFVHCFLDVIREYPEKGQGQNWDDRTLHPDRQGVMTPVSAIWEGPPALIRSIFSMSRMLEWGIASRLWRAAGRDETLRLRLNRGEVGN